MLTKENLSAILLTIILAALTPYTHAGTNGALPMDKLTKHYGTPKVEINLGPDMLKLAGVFAQHEDPKTQKVIAALDSVSVRVFSLNEKPEKAIKQIASMTKAINKEAWIPIVSINEEREKVRIFTKLNQDNIEGLVVLAVNPTEAVLINIVGNISPQDLSAIAEPLQLSQFLSMGGKQ